MGEVLTYVTAGLALVLSAISLLFVGLFSDAAKLHKRLSTTENDLSELADRVHHWLRRSSVRKAREGQDGQGLEAPPPPDPETAKKEMRKTLFFERMKAGRR